MNQIFEKIENLFSRELKLVVKREQENENKIHLYKVGQYWAAFDQSAYLLEQLMGEEDENTPSHWSCTISTQPKSKNCVIAIIRPNEEWTICS